MRHPVEVVIWSIIKSNLCLDFDQKKKFIVTN